ncbi:hypothetical protein CAUPRSCDRAFT_11605 [Caulochytrium protostelioides]|uniref:Uncharacterized protein n=1 Tax=Caulochytrium protostelioides TaxID=1555241 RepID=A0A4P9WZD8_9FUNG|nr:hypothetical protein CAUPRSCDRAFT_11605 [Caulochytrium protostelioides]
MVLFGARFSWLLLASFCHVVTCHNELARISRIFRTPNTNMGRGVRLDLSSETLVESSGQYHAPEVTQLYGNDGVLMTLAFDARLSDYLANEFSVYDTFNIQNSRSSNTKYELDGAFRRLSSTFGHCRYLLLAEVMEDIFIQDPRPQSWPALLTLRNYASSSFELETDENSAKMKKMANALALGFDHAMVTLYLKEKMDTSLVRSRVEEWKAFFNKLAALISTYDPERPEIPRAEFLMSLLKQNTHIFLVFLEKVGRPKTLLADLNDPERWRDAVNNILTDLENLAGVFYPTLPLNGQEPTTWTGIAESLPQAPSGDVERSIFKAVAGPFMHRQKKSFPENIIDVGEFGIRTLARFSFYATNSPDAVASTQTGGGSALSDEAVKAYIISLVEHLMIYIKSPNQARVPFDY